MEVPAITYRIQNAKNLLHRKLDLCVIVIFEFMGTLLFTYCTLNLITLKKQAKSQNSQGFIVYEFVDFSLAMLMCISFTRQFAGAVYNPAIVIFRMLRRTDWYPLRVGILYIVSQFAGAICGGFIGKLLTYFSTLSERCICGSHNPILAPCFQPGFPIRQRDAGQFHHGVHGPDDN